MKQLKRLPPVAGWGVSLAKQMFDDAVLRTAGLRRLIVASIQPVKVYCCSVPLIRCTSASKLDPRIRKRICITLHTSITEI